MSVTKLVVLCGLPGCGKSTYRDKYCPSYSYQPISSDDIIEDHARRHSLTYLESFQLANHEKINNCLIEDFDEAVSQERSIVVDRTCLTQASRFKWLSRVSKLYVTEIVVFNPPFEVILKRNALRDAGRSISVKTLQEMHDRYEEVLIDEATIVKYS